LDRRDAAGVLVKFDQSLVRPAFRVGSAFIAILALIALPLVFVMGNELHDFSILDLLAALSFGGLCIFISITGHVPRWLARHISKIFDFRPKLD
jgi:hypothetical protein